MRNNKLLKIYSLALSSMIFSASALNPVYASGHHVKKRVFSDSAPLSERVKSEGQAVQTGHKRRKLDAFSEPIEVPKGFGELKQLEVAVPVAINKYEICEKIKNLEDEIYNAEIFKKVRVAKNVFDIDLCTGISFRGRNGYYDLKFFKNRVRKQFGKQWDEEELVPLNVVVYYYAMCAIRDLDEINKEQDLDSLNLWKEHKMTLNMRKLRGRTKSLDKLIRKEERDLLFKFQCHIEAVIESLFKVRPFYETLEVKGGISCVENIDTAIAIFWYIDQSIVR